MLRLRTPVTTPASGDAVERPRLEDDAAAACKTDAMVVAAVQWLLLNATQNRHIGSFD